MNNETEIREFLELPACANEAEVASRIEEKLAYFTRLSQAAPNEFLRKTHEKNVEKLRAIQPRYGKASNATAPAQASSSVTAAPFGQSLPRHSTGTQQTAIAWLIRHTENQSPVSFPLFAGPNFIGRNADPGRNCIQVADDSFVSRLHAIVEVNAMTRQARVYDDAKSMGKPSKNGTYINGRSQRITQPTELKENDTLQIGNTKFVFRYNTQPIGQMVREVEQEDYMKTVVISML